MSRCLSNDTYYSVDSTLNVKKDFVESARKITSSFYSKGNVGSNSEFYLFIFLYEANIHLLLILSLSETHLT